MRRLLWGIGLTLLALLLLVMIGLGTLLGTTSGSRWLLAQVPGLNVEAFEGRLGQRWQAERLVWTQGEDRVEVQQPRLAGHRRACSNALCASKSWLPGISNSVSPHPRLTRTPSRSACRS